MDPPFESLLKKFNYKYPLDYKYPRVQVPINGESGNYASEVKLSSLYRQGWPENTNGFEIDFLNEIHAFNFKPIPIFQGRGL